MTDTNPVRVLLVEDNPGDARLITEMLADSQSAFHCRHVARLDDAIDLLQGERCDVTLLDLSLPDAEGTEGIVRLHGHYPQHPIVVMTGLDDETIALNAVHEGAQDYLVKGHCDAAQVTRTLRYAVERKRLDERLAYLANYDELTGLANRTLFMDRLQQAIARAARNSQRAGLLYIDLDGFKQINDSLGHAIGDRLLAEMAKRLRAAVRDCDTVARLGGDEFAVLMEDVSSQRGPGVVAQKILRALRKPISLDGHELQVGASIGIVLYPDAGSDPSMLVQQADAAMYEVKHKGKNGYCQHNGTTAQAQAGPLRSKVETDLRKAVEARQFVLRYQPLVDPNTGAVIALEALLRWRHPRHGLLLPEAFLPALERTGLIEPVGEWVLMSACRQIAAWRRASLTVVPVSVNVSPSQLQDGGLSTTVARILHESGIYPQLLQMELTEHLSIDESSRGKEEIERLSGLGIRFAIDDFGTGYGTCSYLKRFPITTLKVDRMFIHDIARDETSAAVTRFMIGLAHQLDIKVVAEGVETAEQLQRLCALGVDGVQGNLFASPLAVPAITAMLRRGECAMKPARASA